jgi:hypothetical protein
VFRAGILILAVAALPAFAQRGGGAGRGGAGRGAAAAAQSAAPIDLTGSWVSVVTEDWMFRMVTPPKGQFLGVPMNAAARQVANAWDPAVDEASGNACKSYGAAALMRVPGRLRISWSDPNTLKIEAEAGMQTREFHFGGAPPPGGEPTWQGYTLAEWELAATARGGARRGNLKAVTTRMRAGYLRKNGVPYSENAVLTEYFDVYAADNGDIWLVVTAAVHDPQYLTTDFITSSHFKKLPAGDATWRPEPCRAQ